MKRRTDKYDKGKTSHSPSKVKTRSDNMSGLSGKAVEEFKEIYKNKYGRELSDAEAYRLARNLLNLYKGVFGAISYRKREEVPGTKFST